MISVERLSLFEDQVLGLRCQCGPYAGLEKARETLARSDQRSETGLKHLNY